MKKYLFLISALLLVVGVQAAEPANSAQATIDLSVLPEDIRSRVVEAARVAGQSSEMDAEELKSRAIAIGEGIGAGLGATARSLNVAVNEFADTQVGGIAMGLLVWKLIGPDVAVAIFAGWKVLVGLVLLFVASPYCLRRAYTITDSCYDIRYESVPVFFGLLQKRVELGRSSRQSRMSEGETAQWVIFVAMAIVTGITGLRAIL